MYEPDYTDSLRADILPSYNDSLMHHGIRGQKWGVRRYQNPDGSLTPAGKKRYKQSLDYISQVTNFNNENRKELNKKYAITRNNYEIDKEAYDDMINSGSHTPQSYSKMYPYYVPSMEHDRVYSDFLKGKIIAIDNMNKRLNDIDVTKHSYQKTKKLVDNIVDDSISELERIQNNYINSKEYKNYQDMQRRFRKENESSIQRHMNEILGEYGL